ncbi:Rod shape-determining protein MreD [uncultured Paludibacter sp.]|nr:Rod shape-determining protein MreD [uncultured Paludibacter sp.]
MPLAFQIIIRFIVLVFLQIFVLDNIQFLGYINPMIYVLFVLSLPVRFPKWISFLLAFFLGLIIDMFSNTLGMHTFATVFLAFVRTPVINVLTSFDEGVNPVPSYKTFGVNNYVKYVVICVLLHHFTLFMIETFSFTSFTFTFLKILMSSVVTILLILLVQTFKSK